MAPLLECVINVSEGSRAEVIGAIAAAAGDSLLDLHSDAAHNRSVVTIGGLDVLDAAEAIAGTAVERLDLAAHRGVHPRLGVLDVVPFVPLDGGRIRPAGDLRAALTARAAFATWAAGTLALPCFLYGPERTLPNVRRTAFRGLDPDLGPKTPDPHRGAVCVGARQALVAFNLVLEEASVDQAREIARSLRSPEVRALGLRVESGAQVSCNLVAPFRVGPGAVYDRVSKFASVAACELVGLIPAGVLDAEDRRRWDLLDLAPERCIEARLAARR